MEHGRPPPLPIERKLAVAIDLSNSGIRMMRQNIKRRHPEASEREVDNKLADWLRGRPYDAPGVPRSVKRA